MYSIELNNFSIKTVYEIECLDKKMKKNKNVIIDVSGTKYDLIRTVANDYTWN